MPEDVPVYANIRDILRAFIGKRIVDITQHDADEFAEDGRAYVSLLFDDGGLLEFPIGEDGFHVEDGD